MSEGKRRVIRGIPAKTLTSLGYSVCLFPEQPKRQVFEEPYPEESEESIQPSIAEKVQAVVKEPWSGEMVRLYWRNRLIYVIALISFCTSLNNVFHFPMNVYRYGVIFFIPYTLATICIGYPMHVLEASMGQYSQLGPVWMWGCAPLFFGAGFAMLLACVVTSLYYNLFSAYSLVYFAHCFNKVLPWTYCSNIVWDKDKSCAASSLYVSENVSLPSKDYFYNVILNTPSRYPSDVWDLGSFKWWLFLSFLFSWVLIYVATLRSCRSIGKIAIITVIFSYFAILTLLVVAFHVKRSGELILYKEKESVFNVEMWYTAIIQVLLELGICHGIPIVYGSYCRFRNSVHIDSIILCAINYLNSAIFFYLFFCFLRSFSCNYEKMLWVVPDTTVAVVYIIYSEAFTNLSGGHIWCAIFFLMLFLIIIGTQIAIAEAIMTAIYDNFVKLSQHRWLINLLICGTFFVLGTAFCFGNGYFRVTTLYYIPPLFTSIFLSCMFLVGLVFAYGFDVYSQNMKTMEVFNVSVFAKLYLCFLVCIFVIFMIILTFSTHSSLFNGDVLLYPETFTYVAWIVCAFIISVFIVWLPLWIFYYVTKPHKILAPLESWENDEIKKKDGAGQFTSDYSSSYTWEWNNYE